MFKTRKSRLIAYGAAIFLFFFILQMKYVFDVWYDPDELDIYATAFEMVKGKILYREIPSQHMPFTYISSAIFYILGAHEAWIQRIFYYLMFSGFWTGFVFRYKKYVSKWALVLHPLLFLTFMQIQDYSTQILSENLVVIGGEIFLLEFIRFLKERNIDIKGCILMCVAVMFTFGTSFICIFPLFYLGLGVLLTEIKWQVKGDGFEEVEPTKNTKSTKNAANRLKAMSAKGDDDETDALSTDEEEAASIKASLKGTDAKTKATEATKKTWKEWWSYMFKRYGVLFGIVAIPWVVFVIYGLATKSLYDLYINAYVINRLFYPKYNGGMGAGAAGTFLAPITMLANTMFEVKLSDIEFSSALRWITIFTGLMYFPYKIGKKNGWIAGLTTFMFMASFGIRGYYNYHGKAIVALMSMATIIVLVEDTYKSFKSWSGGSLARKGFLVTVMVLIFANYSYNINNLFVIFVNSEYNHYQADTDILKIITDDDERFWQTNMCCSIPWAAKRVTQGPSVSCPWMWEGSGVNKMEDFKKNPTNVVQFQLGYESWGVKMADYAPEAYYYIINNYTHLPTSGQLWVKNDYLETALTKMGYNQSEIEDLIANDLGGLDCTPYEVDESELPGATKEDRDAYWEKINFPETEVEEEVEETTEEVTTEEITTEEVTTEEMTSPDDEQESDPSEDGMSLDETIGDDNSAIMLEEDDTTVSSDGPAGASDSSPASSSTGPGSTTEEVNENTEGAIQAPDGSWIIPDYSDDGPGGN